MHDPSNKNSDDLLDQAIAALRDSAHSSEPPAQVVEQTIRLLSKKGNSMKSILRWAAAAVFVLGAAALIWIAVPRTATLGYAQVLGKVKGVRNVAFKEYEVISEPGQASKTSLREEVTIAGPTRVRTVQHLPSLETTIEDYEAHKSLRIIPADRTAILSDMPATIQKVHLFEVLTNVDPAKSQSVGRRMIDNRPAVGFKLAYPLEQTGTIMISMNPDGSAGRIIASDSQPAETTVWVDEERELPVLVETVINPAASTKTVLYRDFSWDVTINESDFTLTPPAGYSVKAGVTLNLSEPYPTEPTFIAALKMMAERNGGVFPNELNVDAVFAGMKDADADQRATISKGMMFTNNKPNFGDDWHYAGKGVNTGQAQTPIAWYRPTDSQAYRVIYADWQVRDVAEADLPKSPSIKLGTNLPPTTR